MSLYDNEPKIHAAGREFGQDVAFAMNQTPMTDIEAIDDVMTKRIMQDDFTIRRHFDDPTFVEGIYQGITIGLARLASEEVA